MKSLPRPTSVIYILYRWSLHLDEFSEYWIPPIDYYGYSIMCLLCGQYDVFLVSCVSHDGLGRQFLSAFGTCKRKLALRKHTDAYIDILGLVYTISKTITMPQNTEVAVPCVANKMICVKQFEIYWNLLFNIESRNILYSV